MLLAFNETITSQHSEIECSQGLYICKTAEVKRSKNVRLKDDNKIKRSIKELF